MGLLSEDVERDTKLEVTDEKFVFRRTMEIANRDCGLYKKDYKEDY